MSELVTLEQFHAEQRHYHIYRIQSTALDHTDHHHDYFQVCFVTCGEIVHRQEGTSVSLVSGDAFIIPPGFTHALHFGSVYSEMYSLSFDPTLFSPGFPQSGAARFLDGLSGGSPAARGGPVRLRLVLDGAQRRSMEALMDCLLRQQEADCPPELSAAPSLIASILYLLAQSHYRQQDSAPPIDAPDYASALLRCTRYLDRHYREPIRLEELSRRFGLSRSAFCAVFPQFTGMPLRRYVAQKRIQQAQMLIRARPELSLGQIAQEVGYEDPSTFYRNFLRVTGLTPTKYRALYTAREELDASAQ